MVLDLLFAGHYCGKLNEASRKIETHPPKNRVLSANTDITFWGVSPRPLSLNPDIWGCAQLLRERVQCALPHAKSAGFLASGFTHYQDLLSYQIRI